MNHHINCRCSIPTVFIDTADGSKELKGLVGMRLETSHGTVAWQKAPDNPTGSDDVTVDVAALRDYLRSQKPSPEELESIS